MSDVRKTEIAESESVGNDKIQVGDITDSANIVVGKDIHQHIVYEGYSAEEVESIVAKATPQIPHIPSPPEPLKPPITSTFIGRQNELKDFKRQLDTQGRVVITGMAGIGKTALAAALAKDFGDPSKTFWHTFHDGEDIESIVWHLASFLARHGKVALWETLQTTRLTGGTLPASGILFDHLFQLIRGHGYLLCFDDFHLVDADPRLEKLVDRLRPAVRAKELHIIFASRRIPKFIDVSDVKPVVGLCLADTKALIKAQASDSVIADEQIVELHQRTEGNAELLMLTLHAIQQAADPTELVTDLVKSENVERFLLDEIDDKITEVDREVMSGVAALLGYPGTPDAIEEVLDGMSDRRLLAYLANRYLLQRFDTKGIREYGQHAIVRVFYYELISRRQRREMHARAGKFYEQEEVDLLKAALHFECAGEYERSALLATNNIRDLINTGRAKPLLQILECFVPEQLEQQLWIEVNLARGQIYALWGDETSAQLAYELVLSLLEQNVDDKDTISIEVRTLTLLGDLLQYREPIKALEYLQQGMRHFEAARGQLLAQKVIESQRHEYADLLIKLSSVNLAMNRFDQVQGPIDMAFELLRDAPSHLRARGLNNLGYMYIRLGDTKQSITYFEEAVAISTKLHDYYGVLITQGNLANLKFMSGDWPNALSDATETLELAEKLGNNVEQARLSISLGMMYMKKGDFTLAQTYIEQSLELTKKYELDEHYALALSTNAELLVRQDCPADAIDLLEQANKIIAELGAQWMLPEVWRIWAEALLKQHKNAKALNYVQKSIQVAQELGMELEIGMSQRVLGEVEFANGDLERAHSAFEKSLVVLDDVEPYEAAQTRFCWGNVVSDIGELRKGQELKESATSVFERLGAEFELDKM